MKGLLSFKVYSGRVPSGKILVYRVSIGIFIFIGTFLNKFLAPEHFTFILIEVEARLYQC